MTVFRIKVINTPIKYVTLSITVLFFRIKVINTTIKYVTLSITIISIKRIDSTIKDMTAR
jgi:hypothetical protein